MAGEGRELSTRMSLEDQNIDNRLFETVFRHFKRHKVQISNAIKKTFPFFEGLHDNELITSKMYEDCQDSCRNLVPVSRVVYKVLSELEKTFNPSLLEAVFSEVNMQEYPDLNNIYKSFEKVIQEKINYEESNGQKRPAIQLSLEQGMTPRENGLSDHLSETEQMNAKMKDRTSDQNGALESQQANEQCAQESEPAGAKPSNHGLQINSCSVHLEDIKKEKPFFNSEVQLQAQTRTDQVSDIIVISSEDSAESSDGDEFPEPSTPTPRRAAGDLPDQEIEPECPPWQADTLPLSHLGSQNTPIKIEPRNFRKTTTSRKRVWQRVIRSEESLESSEDEAPWGTQSSALRSDPDKDPTDIRNTSIRRRSNRKRWMSGGDSSDLSNEGEPQATSRMSTENQNTEDRLVFETIFRHFKRHKVEISTAIKKTFPFFEGLRDRELITNKMYEDCQDSCRNLVPVPKVVYNVLSELEKTFNQSLLEALFSDVNMQEYPDLNHVRKSFENAIQERLSYEETDGEEREERPAIQLSLEQGTSRGLTWSGGESSSYDGSDLGASMSCLAETSATTRVLEEAGTASPENRLSDHLSETEEINAKRNDTPSNQNDALESQQANEQCDQESEPTEFCEPAPIQSNNSDDGEETPDLLPSNKDRAKPSNHGLQINSCSVHLVDIKKEKPFFNSEVQLQARARTGYNRVSDIIVISSEDSAESSDGDEFPEPSTSTPGRITDPSAIGSTSIFRTSSRKRRMSGGDSSDLSNEGEPQATSSSALINGSDSTDIGSNSTLGKHSGKRRIETVCTEPLKRGRKRGPRVPRDTNMDFRRDQLPVTCGEAMGILYKEKMIKGSSEKCIKDKNGKWFTLKEFEDEGDHKASKNWKQSVRCGGWPLKILIQKGFLPNPSRKRKKGVWKQL